MRDVDTIGSELRLLVAIRQVCRESGGTVPSIRLIDTLLDERTELDTRFTNVPGLCV
jgi:hypothetical protein